MDTLKTGGSKVIRKRPIQKKGKMIYGISMRGNTFKGGEAEE